MSEDTAQACGLVAYRNLNTNTVHLSDGENPDLDARANFERVDLAGIDPAAIDAALRARTERDSTVAAARHRAAGGFTDDPAQTQPFATVVHGEAQPTHDATGILSRPGMSDTPDVEYPWQNPAGQEALERRAQYERANPPHGAGVLAREHEGMPPTVVPGLLPPPATVEQADTQADEADTPTGEDPAEGAQVDDPDAMVEQVDTEPKPARKTSRTKNA